MILCHQMILIFSDLVRVFEARLSNLGIPDEERNLVEIDRLGSTAPAGLI